MAEVSLVINGRTYEIACDDGQEERLQVLAGYLDMRVAELTEQMGQIGELRLLVMAALLVADELQDTLSQLDALEQAQGAGPIPGTSGPGASGDGAAQDALAGTLEDCALRLEKIAARLEGA